MPVRDERFDIVRALAMLCVVTGHLLQHFSLSVPSIIFFTEMPVFYFVSGYFLQRSLWLHGTSGMIASKTRSLLVPYLVWSFVSFAFNLISYYVRGGGVALSTATELAVDVFLGARSVWFFIELYIASVFVILLFRALGNHYMPWALAVWFLFCLSPLQDFLALYKFKWLFPFMLLGLIVSRSMACTSGGKKNPAASVFRRAIMSCSHAMETFLPGILLVLAYLFLCATIFVQDYFDAWQYCAYKSIAQILYGLIYYALSCVGIAACFSLAALVKTTSIGSALSAVGRRTADIYATHMFPIKLIPANVGATVNLGGILPLSFGIVWLCMLIQRHLNKLKIYRAIFGRI